MVDWSNMTVCKLHTLGLADVKNNSLLNIGFTRETINGLRVGNPSAPPPLVYSIGLCTIKNGAKLVPNALKMHANGS